MWVSVAVSMEKKRSLCLLFHSGIRRLTRPPFSVPYLPVRADCVAWMYHPHRCYNHPGLMLPNEITSDLIGTQFLSTTMILCGNPCGQQVPVFTCKWPTGCGEVEVKLLSVATVVFLLR